MIAGRWTIISIVLSAAAGENYPAAVIQSSAEDLITVLRRNL